MINLKEILEQHRKWVHDPMTGQKANLRGADLYGASLCGANLRGADLRGANLCDADLYGASLCGANLRGADLYGASLCGANLRGADLRGANLCDADLYGADLYGASLCGANLRGADLRGANLCDADLYGASLYGANLCGASLYGANLRGVNLGGADLRGANLCGANLRGAKNLARQEFEIVPQTGSFTGYKKVQGDIILELRIAKSARRSSAPSSRKCRADRVKVIKAFDTTATVFRSKHDSSFVYTVGKISTEPNFENDWTIECAAGIHFFLTKEEAERY